MTIHDHFWCLPPSLLTSILHFLCFSKRLSFRGSKPSWDLKLHSWPSFKDLPEHKCCHFPLTLITGHGSIESPKDTLCSTHSFHPHCGESKPVLLVFRVQPPAALAVLPSLPVIAEVCQFSRISTVSLLCSFTDSSVPSVYT